MTPRSATSRCATILREFVRVLIDYRPALRDRTGVGEWVHSLVSALVDIGRDGDPLDLTVFSSSWKDRLSSAPPPVHTVDLRIPVKLLNFSWHRVGWPPVEWLAGSRYDVVHSPHPLLIPTNCGAQVVTIHDLDFLDHPERTTAEVQRDYADLVRTHVQQASRVVVPSRFTATEVEHRLGVNGDRITVCYNGAPDWPARADWPARGHILFVGSLTARKNVGQLLDAYRILLDRDEGATLPPLMLVGPPTTQASDWLTAIERPPLQGHVHYTGYVDRSALRRLYEGASVLVLPSFHEGFGLPVVEAMTIGVPVVVSDRGALPEVVGDAGLIVEPTAPIALAAAIERMLTDEPFARACAERGFQQAARFSWRESAKTLRTAYELAAS
jgi:glycosyltransferase involved in cell wall biosynthesis